MIQTKHKFLYKACDANCACKRKSMKSEFTKRERTKLGVLVCSAAIVFCFPPLLLFLDSLSGCQSSSFVSLHPSRHSLPPSHPSPE